MKHLTVKEAYELLTLICKKPISVRTIQHQCKNGYIKNVVRNGCYFIEENDIKNYKTKKRGRIKSY